MEIRPSYTMRFPIPILKMELWFSCRFGTPRWRQGRGLGRSTGPAQKLTYRVGVAWWRHQMEHFPSHWPFVGGIHRSPMDSPHKASDTEHCCFLDLRLNKRLSKQSGRQWFETPSLSLWCYCNCTRVFFLHFCFKLFLLCACFSVMVILVMWYEYIYITQTN